MKISQTQLECMEEAAQEIIETNRQIIISRYGELGENKQDYHNIEHTNDVIDAVIRMGDLAIKRCRITQEERILLPISASGHDRYYDPYNKYKNEEISLAETLVLVKKYTCFSEDHYNLIEKHILTTKVQKFYPRIIQSCYPEVYSSLIIADADLSSFGKPFDDFKPRAMGYYKELKSVNNQDFFKYLQFEANLLDNHKWYTEEANELFPHVIENKIAIENLMSLHAVQ